MKINNNNDGYGYMRLTYLLTVFLGLPITRRKINNRHNRNRYTDVQGHRYSFDPLALPVWLAFAALEAYVLYYNYMYVARYVGGSFKQCFEESYCFAVIELVNRNVGPFAVLACIAFHGRRHKVIALAGTERTLTYIRYTDRTDRDRAVRLSTVFKYNSAAVIVAYCCCLSIYTIVNVQPKSVMLMYTANAMTQTAVFNLVVFQYYVLERGYARVNRLLDTVDLRAGNGTRSLARLADAHDQLGRLVRHTNHAYTLGQLVRWPYSVIRLVMVVFRVIEFSANVHLDDRPTSTVAVVLIVEHSLEILLFLYQLSSFCVVGARLAKQAERTLASLQKLKLSCGFNLDLEIKKTIDNFWIQVSARKVNATIGGFFIINMDIMKSICGIIATYFLVLIQFKFQKSTSKPLHPVED